MLAGERLRALGERASASGRWRGGSAGRARALTASATSAASRDRRRDGRRGRQTISALERRGAASSSRRRRTCSARSGRRRAACPRRAPPRRASRDVVRAAPSTASRVAELARALARRPPRRTRARSASKLVARAEPDEQPALAVGVRRGRAGLKRGAPRRRRSSACSAPPATSCGDRPRPRRRRRRSCRRRSRRRRSVRGRTSHRSSTIAGSLALRGPPDRPDRSRGEPVPCPRP